MPEFNWDEQEEFKEPEPSVKQSMSDKFSDLLKMAGHIAGSPQFAPALGMAQSGLDTARGAYPAFRMMMSPGEIFSDRFSKFGKSAPPERLPKSDLQQFVSPDPISQIGFKGGQLVGDVAPFAGVGRAMKGLPLLQRALAGSATGATVSPDHRILGGAMGALGVEGEGAQKLSENLAREVHPVEIANDIVNTQKANKALYSKRYDNVLDEGEKLGYVSKGGFTNENINTIKNVATKTTKQTIDDFIDSPTVENAHRLQSDLGKMANRLNRRTTLEAPHLDGIEVANNLKHKLRDSLVKTFIKKGRQDLADEYGNITKGYERDVIPYQKSKAIQAFNDNKIGAKTFVDKLLKDEEFLMSKGNVHRGLTNRQRLKHSLGLAKKYGIPAAAAFGVFKGGEHLSDALREIGD